MPLKCAIDEGSHLQKIRPNKKMDNYRPRIKESIKRNSRKVASIAVQITDHVQKPGK
jgi:hypothetical protein